jgi:hypothetical protein
MKRLTILVDVVGCARCGRNHLALDFKPFTKPCVVPGRPTRKFTHWASCPRKKEPILMRLLSN